MLPGLSPCLSVHKLFPKLGHINFFRRPQLAQGRQTWKSLCANLPGTHGHAFNHVFRHKQFSLYVFLALTTAEREEGRAAQRVRQFPTPP